MSNIDYIKKVNQGFKKEAPACRNCSNYSEGVCCIGRFKVNKTNYCKKHCRV